MVITTDRNFNRAAISVGVTSKSLKFQHLTKRKKKKITLTTGKDFQCPWTDLRWTMLVTWRLFEAFNVPKIVPEIWCIPTKWLNYYVF